ncbi:Rapamycin-insensitive companion of mTOR, N-term-domain-containing protein [Verticillium dahliae]|nr:Protein AIM2 [Verticillium dahliae VDG2]KAH6708428.1 Rapamycin-insensitive companion of mTOR, N-term-domain-containing protein [Verticillium dahliae]
MLGVSQTARDKAHPSQQQPSAVNNTRTSIDRDGPSTVNLYPPSGPASSSARSLAASAANFAPRGSSLNPSVAPGSFSSELRSQMNSSRAGSRADLFNNEKIEENEATMAEQKLNALREQLNRELKIKEGSENMLDALNSKKAKQTKEQRARVENELNASNNKIRELRQRIAEAQAVKLPPSTPTRSRTAEPGSHPANGLRSPHSVSRSGAGSDFDEPVEQSPTFSLTEILQDLEVEGMGPEYYVSRGNALVDLLRRHPSLKYDLVWPVFGLRMQVMLLSDAREVVAAGYRMVRYAISDISSLKKIRNLNTDYLVITSLIKDRKADLEREQALKFVRAFLDVKGGVNEISRAVVRAIAAVAAQEDDRLQSMCVETLAEILLRCPPLAIASGALPPLSEALNEGSYKSPDTIANTFLYLFDNPQRRKYLRSGYDLEVMFTAFTDPTAGTESLLKQNSKAIAKVLRSWSGFMVLGMHDFRAIRSLMRSMVLPQPMIKETVVDLVFILLRIKPPSWATSFLAGRRLTTYGRVANLKSISTSNSSGTSSGAPPVMEDEAVEEQSFLDHYTALLLSVLVKCDLLPNLLHVAKNSEAPLTRKTCLLIGEVLKLASRLLPQSASTQLPLLPELFAAATQFKDDERFISSGIVYQISQVSKTLYRMSDGLPGIASLSHDNLTMLAEEQQKGNPGVVIQDTVFRQLLVESNVLNSSNYLKWDWDTILKMIDGPLQNGKRLDETIRVSKFMNRIMSFYRPFKNRFADLSSNKNTQKYVRIGCALMHTLLQSNEGIVFLRDSKLLRQLAECLAQCDPSSGLTSADPVFAPYRLQTTLCAGYFPMLGVLSSDPKGLELLQRWRMFNMMYHILSHKQRPDLIHLLLLNFDYTVPGHTRVLLEQALTSGTRETRIIATKVLRKYATRPFNEANRNHDKVDWKWAIRKLVDQLYDPDVEVCRTAVKILEKSCNKKAYLEYVVQCRPAMDHLGEMSAPLLLRFLSSSSGYHYLDGLDYISNEMDDWFLGRNDTYVDLIETSLAKAFSDHADEQQQRLSMVDQAQAESMEPESHLPPHFYRELARTEEGCRMLRDKGHFAEFASTIRDYGMQSADPELLLKVKGCMWAVGNVGSMELGAPFLESCDVVQDIVKIAQEHDMMSLRGTAFFVLGLISRSIHGLEILLECGWDSNLNNRGHSVGFCVPDNLSRFFSYKPWKHTIAPLIRLPDTQKTILTPPPPMPARPPLEKEELPPAHDEAATNQRIVDLIVDLSNIILFKHAISDLKQLKLRKAPGFRSPKLFKRIIAMLEYNHYRLPIRRMVIELFDKSVLRTIVFEEDTDTEEEEDTLKPKDRIIEEDENASVSGDESRTERQRSVSNATDARSEARSSREVAGGRVITNKFGAGGFGARVSQSGVGSNLSRNNMAQDGDSSSEEEESSSDEESQTGGSRGILG